MPAPLVSGKNLVRTRPTAMDAAPTFYPRMGQYRVRFETATYHAAQGVKGLYVTVEIIVTVRPEDTHLHVPLLLSPNGYTTYRGS
jgi:5-hydroxyisourate hydrolase-like protein (transthyretin family)